MIKLGVFYCPENNLKNEIESVKSFFTAKSQINQYLDHLAHMTVYVFDIHPTKLPETIQKFENLQNILLPLSSEITNWKVFENDLLTNLNTLCLEIELTADLFQLQTNVVNDLQEFHTNKIKKTFDGVFKVSNDKYGYPFVGKHWIPHFTIGSMEIEVNKIIEFSTALFHFSKPFTINNLSLFKIEKDSHFLIKKIEF